MLYYGIGNQLVIYFNKNKMCLLAAIDRHISLSLFKQLNDALSCSFSNADDVIDLVAG